MMVVILENSCFIYHYTKYVGHIASSVIRNVLDGLNKVTRTVSA